MRPTAVASSTVWVCEECEPALGRNHYIGSIGLDGICVRCGGLAMMVFDKQALEPRLDRYGPTVRTHYSLVPRETFHIWDVNGFYRDLGVSPYASRLELRRAYQQALGHDDDWLTYIIKFLLNETKRAHYDKLCPGEWIFDPRVEESVRRQAMREVMDALDSGDVTADDLQGSMDFSDVRDQVVDNRPGRGKDDRRPGPSYSFEWRSYLWRTVRNDVRVGRWQELLLRAFAGTQEVFEFAVGLAGDGMASPWSIEVISGLTVIFLGDDEELTLELAQQAAQAVKAHPRLILENHP